MIESEKELIRRAQAHDTDSFCALADRHGRRIYLLAFHYCQNSQDAEDLSQEVWLKAYQSLHTFRFDSSFYTWLRRITINTFLNHRRSASSQPENKIELETAESQRSTPFVSEERVYDKVLFETVMNAMDELTPSQRLIFLLRHYEGMSYEEIASAMNCSTGTAKKAVWRALSKLRAKLDISSDIREETVPSLAAEY